MHQRGCCRFTAGQWKFYAPTFHFDVAISQLHTGYEPCFPVENGGELATSSINKKNAPMVIQIHQSTTTCKFMEVLRTELDNMFFQLQPVVFVGCKLIVKMFSCCHLCYLRGIARMNQKTKVSYF